jgi:hypothetical protein
MVVFGMGMKGAKGPKFHLQILLSGKQKLIKTGQEMRLLLQN